MKPKGKPRDTVPLFGNLFRLERSTRSKTELYIVITPRIVRHRRFSEDASPGVEGAVKPD